MLTEHKLKNWMGLILVVGISISIIFVTVGGIIFLLQHGTEPFQNNISLTTRYNINIETIFQGAQLSSPMRLIEIGLLVLVMAQVLRVALLCYYFTRTRDYWFMLFSFFILSVILYSLIWQ